MKQINFDAVWILLALFVMVSAAQFFKIPVDQSLLMTILVALNVKGNSNGYTNGNGTTGVAGPEAPKTPPAA